MKTIILVRHGQYSRNPEKLTALGKKQAKFTARCLKDYQAGHLLSSTMPRAIETAQIIGKHLKLPTTKKKIFRESSLPIRNQDFQKVHGTKISVRERKKLNVSLAKNQKQADLAFRSLFQNPHTGNSETVVLVSHGNVIRYWVCRALNIDVKKWLRMDIHQCSITTLQVDSDGEIKVLGFSDIGHIPYRLRTYL